MILQENPGQSPQKACHEKERMTGIKKKERFPEEASLLLEIELFFANT